MNDRYTVEIEPAAARQLAKLDRSAREEVAAAIQALADNPRPRGCIKLSARHDQWRIKAGRSYRIIYEIHDHVLVVTVIEIGHRREVYQR